MVQTPNAMKYTIMRRTSVRIPSLCEKSVYPCWGYMKTLIIWRRLQRRKQFGVKFPDTVASVYHNVVVFLQIHILIWQCILSAFTVENSFCSTGNLLWPTLFLFHRFTNIKKKNNSFHKLKTLLTLIWFHMYLSGREVLDSSRRLRSSVTQRSFLYASLRICAKILYQPDFHKNKCENTSKCIY